MIELHPANFISGNENVTHPGTEMLHIRMALQTQYLCEIETNFIEFDENRVRERKCYTSGNGNVTH